MSFWGRALPSIAAIAMLANGCVSESSLQAALAQLESERQRNDAARKQLDAQRQEIARAQAEAAQLREQNTVVSAEAAALRAAAAEFEAKLAAQASVLAAAAKKGVKLPPPPPPKAPDAAWADGLAETVKTTFPDELRDGRITLSVTPERAAIVLAEALVFDPDDVEVSIDGEAVLTRLAEALRAAGNRQLVIGAHYDTSAMASAMAREFPTAWEFTAARAVSVARFFEEERRIAPQRLAATAYGSARAATSNSTEAGRARNRRIELTVLR